jgi:hypothetical protein
VKPGSREWLEAKSKGPLHEYTDTRGIVHRGYMERYLDHGGTDQTAYMRDKQTGELSLISGSRLKLMRIVTGEPRCNPARKRRAKKRAHSERGFFPQVMTGRKVQAHMRAGNFERTHRFAKRKLHGRGRLVKRRRNPAIRLTWHEFAGGTGAAEGKNSYQAITGGLNGREQYLIDPISWPNGRHRYYKLQYFGAGGYRTLGTNARVAALKKMAAEHLLGVVLTATNPRRRRRNPATHVRKGVALGHYGRLHSARLARKRGVHQNGPYKVQVHRHKKWITLAEFPFHASAVDYGRALKTRYPSKSFRVFW